MPQKVLIIDTSILCVWIGIPDKETCGPNHDKWDKERVEAFIQRETGDGAPLVLPLASIIETGNHIAQARTAQKRDLAISLSDKMKMAAEEKTPWAAFTDQQDLWDSDGLKKLADEWPDLAVQGISLGDATIKSVADRYVRAGFLVEILTGDVGLKSLEPMPLLKRSKRHERRRNQRGNGRQTNG
jgi:hypothetical protein